MLRVTINEYLEEIQAEEERLLAESLNYTPRHIPDKAELARGTNSSIGNYYKWSGNRTKKISRETTFDTIMYLKSLGFDTQLTDILRCYYDKI